MKNVHVFSRKEFEKMCEAFQLTTELVDYSDYAVISIENNGKAHKHILKDGKRVLNVEFDDVDVAENGFKPISEETATKIFEFIDKLNRESDIKGHDLVLIVHCGAGISRSGAVGLFASELFGISYETFKQNNPRVNHNRRVYTELLKACGRYYGC